MKLRVRLTGDSQAKSKAIRHCSSNKVCANLLELVHVTRRIETVKGQGHPAEATNTAEAHIHGTHTWASMVRVRQRHTHINT